MTSKFLRIMTIVLAIGVATTSATARADDPDPAEAARRVAEGNRLLDEGKVEDALKEYDAAAVANPESPEVAYNRGLALYRLKKFDEAEKAFQSAVRPDRTDLEARAKYNLGRSAHAAAQVAAESQAGDDQTAIAELAKAIRYYDEALQIAPNDADAKLNRELAERMIRFIERQVQKKKEQQQQQNQPSSQPSSQPNDQGDQNSPSSQPSSQPTSQPNDQSQTSQPSSQPSDAQQGQDGDDPKDADQDASGEEKDDKDQKESEARERRDAGQPGEMRRLTKEEAERYLQQARDAEARRRKLRRQMEMQQRGRIPVEKDW